MNSKEKSVLVLIKGDRMSQEIRRIAKKFGFAGTTMTVSFKQATADPQPYPLLITENDFIGYTRLFAHFGQPVPKTL